MEECVRDTREHRGSPQGPGTSRVTLFCPRSRMHLWLRGYHPDTWEQEAETPPPPPAPRWLYAGLQDFRPAGRVASGPGSRYR